ncbi:GTPase ObgE [Lactobacillus acetotolerans]|uniref:GTPase Obg n=1 Tax=Lactobacillus acetotolerans TaxID=1600 RepID=A0A5P5ZIX5_9LACO|nr:GTPase ObgE [Lactobacillus acetotolerans]KRN41842.1 GTPase obg [Lactobacillus acetotolerans DSM 20749 = JCM 3825]QFG51369.1 GTPase ObgE [Lactobacillus acetotolerans]QGV04518.1 GTPase ObgE [Lactobacillus acetotolerans]QJD73666.1 GTPase ObgE [Lactobacillus acetotolerans]GGV09644.1 GTPase Obg [Lactobacillus acetotolerans DSM 20749 = JCM 3825]
MPTFVDQTKIEVQAGKGGDGMVAFRHEKYVPNGGPAGGDGGRGGSIIFVADSGLRTLMDFRYRRKFKAEDGEKGRIKSQYGRGAKDLYLKVPVGTTVYDFNSNEELGDLIKDKQELVVAHGGRGGRGNIHFASSVNTAPEIAENGEPGEDRVLRLELKMLADVGLVGFPSVGKSTLLSVVTKAKPKIAAYAFTTLTPNLGMVILPDGRDFSIADLPGLIEGASKGVGLGIQFLRHIERTKVILHLVSMDPNNGQKAINDYKTIKDEMLSYDTKLSKKRELIVATQMDLPGSEDKLADFKKDLKSNGINEPVYAISSVAHKGVKKLMQDTASLVEEVEKTQVVAKPKPVHKVKEYKYKAPKKNEFTVEKVGEHEFVVKGESLERLVEMTNLDHHDGVVRLARKLMHLGIDEALRKKGAVDGDDVAIGDFNFEFVQ